MVAEFNLDGRSNYPTSQSLIPEKLKSFFKTFEEVCDTRQTNHPLNPRSVIRLVAEECQLEFVKRSGYFLLIDELLTKGESAKNPAQCKKLLFLAAKLLKEFRQNCLVISSSNEGVHEEFVAKILEKADSASQIPHSSAETFKQRARELKTRFNDLLSSFSQNIESNCPRLKDAMNQFIASWQEFTALSLEERLKSLGGPENSAHIG